MTILKPRSRVGLGCELLGGTDWGSVDLDDAVSAVRHAWDNGVTVFDTADVYGLGLSEVRLRDALGSSRHEATIVTKFGVRWKHASGRAKTWRDSSPNYAVSALEASLRRLQIEQIPVYLVHWPDGVTSLEELTQVLAGQQSLGKIGSFGLSNFDRESIQFSICQGAEVVELPLSLVERTHLDDFRELEEAGITTVAYGVLAQGLLTGKYNSHAKFSSSDRRHRLPHFQGPQWAANQNTLSTLQQVADDLGARPSEVALAWVLHQGADVALFGARTPEQVASALRAAELISLPDVDSLLDRLTAARPLDDESRSTRSTDLEWERQ